MCMIWTLETNSILSITAVWLYYYAMIAQKALELSGNHTESLKMDMH